MDLTPRRSRSLTGGLFGRKKTRDLGLPNIQEESLPETEQQHNGYQSGSSVGDLVEQEKNHQPLIGHQRQRGGSLQHEGADHQATFQGSPLRNGEYIPLITFN